MHILTKTTIATLVALYGAQIHAAGFQSNSQSARGISRAFAGEAAIADSAAVISRNAAGMELLKEEAHITVGAAYVDAQVDVKNIKNGNTTVGSGELSDISEDKTVPTLFFHQRLNDSMSVGIGVFSYFGTSTDMKELGTDSAVTVADLFGYTEVMTIDFAAAFSYRINEQFSLGLTLDVIYGSGVLNRRGKFGPAFSNASIADVAATGTEFGASCGMIWELNDDNRFGLNYRYNPQIDAKHGVVNTTALDGTGTAQINTSFDKVIVPLPDMLAVSGHHIMDQWAFSWSANLTMWSAFDKVEVKNPTTAILKEYQWQDSWSVAVAASYMIDSQWTVRLGYMYDADATDKIESLSIPDSDRNWITTGFSYDVNDQSSVDFGFAYIIGSKKDITEQSAKGTSASSTYTAEVSPDAMYFALGYNYSF